MRIITQAAACLAETDLALQKPKDRSRFLALASAIHRQTTLITLKATRPLHLCSARRITRLQMWMHRPWRPSPRLVTFSGHCWPRLKPQISSSRRWRLRLLRLRLLSAPRRPQTRPHRSLSELATRQTPPPALILEISRRRPVLRNSSSSPRRHLCFRVWAGRRMCQAPPIRRVSHRCSPVRPRPRLASSKSRRGDLKSRDSTVLYFSFFFSWIFLLLLFLAMAETRKICGKVWKNYIFF